MLANGHFGSYCSCILVNLLRKDPRRVEQLLEFRVIDGLLEALTNKGNSDKLLCSNILLARQLLQSDDSPERRVLRVLEARGVVRAIGEL